MELHYTFLFFVFVLPYNLADSQLSFKMKDNFNRDLLCQQIGDKNNETVYVYFQDKVKWSEAYFYCLQHKMELLKFLTMDDVTKFKTWISLKNVTATMLIDEKPNIDYVYLWVSARRTGSNKHDFMAVPEMTPVSYTNWETEEPDHILNRDVCVAFNIVPLKMADDACDRDNKFVCQTQCNNDDSNSSNDCTNWGSMINEKP